MNKLRLPSRQPSKPPPETGTRSTGPSLAARLRTERLRITSPSESQPPRSTPDRLKIPPKQPDRILAFDIENKPGTYGPGDYTHPKVTAIACQFVGEPHLYSWCLNRRDRVGTEMQLDEFIEQWNRSTMVMGHNIRGHDIRILNGLCVSLGRPILEPRRTIDTFRDLPKTAGFSRSLENLCARWGCPVEKVHMPEHVWEEAYDGVREATDRMRLRVETDVTMNLWLYAEEKRRGLL